MVKRLKIGQSAAKILNNVLFKKEESRYKTICGYYWEYKEEHY
jgi:hypothetical protein